MKSNLNTLLLSFAFSASAYATGPSDVFEPDTLLIDVPASELQKNPVWQNHGIVFDEFLNVQAFSNRRDGEYQCTELVHRFLRTIYDVPTRIGIGLGNADVLIQNIYQRFSGDTYQFNDDQNVSMVFYQAGRASEPPAAGSVVNFSSGNFGHAAVVRYVEILSTSTVKIYLFEQHGFPVWQPGQVHGLRSVIFTKDTNNKWSAPQTPGIGRAISWLNFKIANESD